MEWLRKTNRWSIITLKKKKAKKLPNYSEADIIVRFHGRYKDSPKRYCCIRNYQSSFDFKSSQQGEIIAKTDGVETGKLIDDGNGVHLFGKYYNYSEFDTLKMLILAHENSDPYFDGTEELDPGMV